MTEPGEFSIAERSRQVPGAEERWAVGGLPEAARPGPEIRCRPNEPTDGHLTRTRHRSPVVEYREGKVVADLQEEREALGA